MNSSQEAAPEGEVRLIAAYRGHKRKFKTHSTINSRRGTVGTYTARAIQCQGMGLIETEVRVLEAVPCSALIEIKIVDGRATLSGTVSVHDVRAYGLARQIVDAFTLTAGRIAASHPMITFELLFSQDEDVAPS